MNWIINNPIDAFQLAWSIELKYCAVFCLMTIVMAILFSRLLKWRKKRVVCSTIAVMFIGFTGNLIPLQHGKTYI